MLYRLLQSVGCSIWSFDSPADCSNTMLGYHAPYFQCFYVSLLYAITRGRVTSDHRSTGKCLIQICLVFFFSWKGYLTARERPSDSLERQQTGKKNGPLWDVTGWQLTAAISRQICYTLTDTNTQGRRITLESATAVVRDDSQWGHVEPDNSLVRITNGMSADQEPSG